MARHNHSTRRPPARTCLRCEDLTDQVARLTAERDQARELAADLAATIVAVHGRLPMDPDQWPWLRQVSLRPLWGPHEDPHRDPQDLRHP